MLRFFSFLSALLILSSLSPLWAADDPELIVELDRTKVYEGESIVYRITLNHVKDGPQPTLVGFDDFQVVMTSTQPIDSRQTINVNGRITVYERFGTMFYYRLTPRKTGSLRIPSPTAEVDGKTLRGEAIAIEVIAPQDQEVVLLEIESDRDTVYPQQRFAVTLRILIKALPDPYSKESPIAVQRNNPPALSLPWVANLPSGLSPETEWRQWLDPIESRGSFFGRGKGFTINKISAFFPGEVSTYLPTSRRVKRQNKAGESVDYWEFTLKRAFLPMKVETFTFGPVTLKGLFAVGLNAQRDGLSGEDIFAVGRAVQVMVKDAPQEGRPPNYTGAIGEFSFSGSLAPARALVGDPLTLTLTLKGDGTLDRAQAPDLAALPEIADRFKIYEATVDTKGHARTYTYSLRAMKAGVDPFPAIPYAYFDVERERFVTLQTREIPLHIEAADQLAEDDIISGPAGPNGTRRDYETRKEGIFGNVAESKSLRNQAVNHGLYGAVLIGMALFYMLFSLITHKVRKVSSDHALQRRRGASGRVRARVQEATALIRQGQVGEGLEIARTAVTGLVADAADLSEAGLTIRDIRERLTGFKLETELVDRVDRFLETCDAARFGEKGSADASLAQACESLIDTLLKALKQQGRLR